MNEELHRKQVNKAVKKYHREKIETMTIHVPKGRREYYKAAATEAGESLNVFAVRAMDELIERESLQAETPEGSGDPGE